MRKRSHPASACCERLRTLNAVDTAGCRTQDVFVGISLTRLTLAALVVALLVVPAADAKGHNLRFKILSVQGQQTVTWNDTQAFGDCGTIARSGSQTISFESTGPTRLSLLRIPRYNKAGKRRGVTYYGINFIHSDWTFSRSFEQSPAPSCPEEPVFTQAAQASDCGTQGPFAVPIDIGWREGAVQLRAVLDHGAPGQRSPHYRSCEYDGFHEFDLIDSKGRLPQRRLVRRPWRPLRVEVSAHSNEPTAESEGSQTTTLEATVTLKRVGGS
jgi:hypothetical protein